MADSAVAQSPDPPDRMSYLVENPYPMPEFDENVIKSLSHEFSKIAEEDAIDDVAAPEPIKTYLRIRPYDKKSEEEVNFLEVKDEGTVVANSTLPGSKGLKKVTKKTEYKFTRVLESTCSQQQVFEYVVGPLMDRFERGENCLVFSYGATNSGKTYTMQGSANKYGIIPRTLDHVFNRYQDRIYANCDIQPVMHESTRALSLEEQKTILDKKLQLLSYAAKTNEMKCRTSVSTSETSSHCGSLAYYPGYTGEPGADLSYRSAGTYLYSMWVSFVELYNEKCYDLLDSVATLSTKAQGKRKVLRVVSDKSGNSYMKDLTEIPVYNEEEAFGIYVAGTKRLQMGSTQINQSSSRSHCFFSIRVVELGSDKSNVFPVHTHRITFCDLAGMERVSQTENTGQQLRESANINNSLLSLLKVIRMIREKQTCSTSNGQSFLEKIPFRDSQLTRIFRGYFTSCTHIVMLVNVNPSPNMIESSTLTLQSSAIARNIIAFRQPPAPKVMIEDTRMNSSILHSSRDMEDILEEDEEQVGKENVIKGRKNFLKPSRNKHPLQEHKSPRQRKGPTDKNQSQFPFKSSKAYQLKMAETQSIDEFSDESDKENEQASEILSDTIQYSLQSYVDRIIHLEHVNSSLAFEKEAYVNHCNALKDQNRICKEKYAELLDKLRKAQQWNETLQNQLAEKDAETESIVALAVQEAKEEMSRLFIKRMETQEQLNRENNERTQKMLLAKRERETPTPNVLRTSEQRSSSESQ